MGFHAELESNGTVLVRVSAPSAQTVEVSGDFTGWSPVALSRQSGDWWSVSVPMIKGDHQIAMRVNCGEWVAPPGLVPLKDEFGGISGLLVIP
jgi:1,4-alpha-glucan branching enzyme